MSVANAAAVDAAILTALATDVTLAALLPGGVYRDVAPANRTRFAIVQQQTHEDVEGFVAPLYEAFQYRITARILETTGGDADAAADRIHVLLQDVPLVVAGYTWMSTLRVDRVRLTEVDATDSDIRWQQAGGDYEVFVSPT
jgi:hypothetical protein